MVICRATRAWTTSGLTATGNSGVFVFEVYHDENRLPVCVPCCLFYLTAPPAERAVRSTRRAGRRVHGRWQAGSGPSFSSQFPYQVLPVSAAGGPVTFEFTPAEDEPQRTTMHFRFGQTPGTVDLDDIRVEEPYHRARRFAAVHFRSQARLAISRAVGTLSHR